MMMARTKSRPAPRMRRRARQTMKSQTSRYLVLGSPPARSPQTTKRQDAQPTSRRSSATGAQDSAAVLKRTRPHSRPRSSEQVQVLMQHSGTRAPCRPLQTQRAALLPRYLSIAKSEMVLKRAFVSPLAGAPAMSDVSAQATVNAAHHKHHAARSAHHSQLGCSLALPSSVMPYPSAIHPRTFTYSHPHCNFYCYT